MWSRGETPKHSPRTTMLSVCVYVVLAGAAANCAFMTVVWIFLEIVKLSVLGQCPQRTAIF